MARDTEEKSTESVPLPAREADPRLEPSLSTACDPCALPVSAGWGPVRLRSFTRILHTYRLKEADSLWWLVKNNRLKFFLFPPIVALTTNMSAKIFNMPGKSRILCIAAAEAPAFLSPQLDRPAGCTPMFAAGRAEALRLLRS